jgi:hypothetical protein
VHADRALASIVVRCAALAGVVGFAAVPVYVWVEPSWRTLVTRLAAAVVLGVTLLQLRRALVERLVDDGPWALDEARRHRPTEPSVPHHFLGLRGDVRAALGSRRYFERGLWPRLVALARHPLVPPPSRRGRGPSLANLRRVIADIERDP